MPSILLALFTLLTFVGTIQAQDFDESINIASEVNVDAVKKLLSKNNKPGVVFVTQPWCGACKGLKKSINGDDSFKALLEQFVVVHATGDDGTQWQAEGQSDGYIPRVYFLSAQGEMIKVPPPNSDYAYFFPSSDAVKKGMQLLLAEHEKANPKKKEEDTKTDL